MITPRFEVTQDDQAVVVTIHAPHLRSQDIDIHIQDFQLRFFAKPYFLRLTFPGQVVEDDQSTAKYDIAQGELVLRVSKAEPGEHFPDLDLLSKLLATTTERKTQLSHGPLIEVVGETVTSEIPSTDDHLDPAHAQDHNGDEDDDDDDDEEEEAEYDWDLPQEIEPEVSATPALLNQARYGFENQHHGLFTHVQEMGNEINCLSSPETLSPEGRRRERIAQEEAKFDPDYYLSDLFDNDEIAELLAYQSPWKQCLREIRRQLRAGPSSTLVQLTTATLPPLLASFTEAEQEQMRALPRKLLTVDAGMERSLYLGLVDLVFAYSYNLRTTLGESTVESVWTVGILSSLLAALDHHRPSLKAVAVASFRRALAYPLYRHWELCQAVWRDTQTIFKLGRRALVKVLLNLKDMFDHHDTYYVYSKIWFDDYCVWIQNGASDKKLQSLAKELDALVLTKLDLDWSLAELEAQALE
ncbi:SHQ1 protein-domain-containing protein, partial [Dimargaris cristalligena]